MGVIQNKGLYWIFGVAIFLLSLPLIVDHSGLLDQATVYRSISHRLGPYNYIDEQVIRQDKPIDILFIGSSSALAGIYPAEIIKKIEEGTGHRLEIANLSTNWRGVDLFYLILKDILKKRKIGMVVVSHGLSMGWNPHPAACYLVSGQPLSERIGDGLPLAHQLSYYGCKILLYPKLLFFKLTGLLEQQHPSYRQVIEDPYGEALQNVPDTIESLLERSPNALAVPVEEQILQTNQMPENGKVSYKTGPRTVMERLFYSKIQKLCREQDIPLAVIRIPLRNDPLDHIKIRPLDMENGYDEVPLIVRTLSELFPNLSQEEISSFYYDNDHFTPYGAQRYSRSISEAVSHLYNTHSSQVQKDAIQSDNSK